MPFINVQGAYGRTYETIQQAKEDWKANKDFQILYNGTAVPGGQYINRADHSAYAPTADVNVKLTSGAYASVTI